MTSQSSQHDHKKQSNHYENADLKGKIFNEVNLRGVSFNNCQLNNATFSNVEFGPKRITYIAGACLASILTIVAFIFGILILLGGYSLASPIIIIAVVQIFLMLRSGVRVRTAILASLVVWSAAVAVIGIQNERVIDAEFFSGLFSAIARFIGVALLAYAAALVSCAVGRPVFAMIGVIIVGLMLAPSFLWVSSLGLLITVLVVQLEFIALISWAMKTDEKRFQWLARVRVHWLSLKSTRFTNCDLTDASFTHSSTSVRIDLSGVDFSSANLTRVNWQGVKNLDLAKLPEGFSAADVLSAIPQKQTETEPRRSRSEN